MAGMAPVAAKGDHHMQHEANRAQVAAFASAADFAARYPQVAESLRAGDVEFVAVEAVSDAGLAQVGQRVRALHQARAEQQPAAPSRKQELN
jgi:hypothetical protein